MARIAIPHWQGRVSPVFDVAGRVLLADIISGEIIRCGDLQLGAEDPHNRSVLLSSTGVEVLLCGAISCSFELALTAVGIRVRSQICGPIELVLQAYMSGQLDCYQMPGCRGGLAQGRGGRGGKCQRD